MKLMKHWILAIIRAVYNEENINNAAEDGTYKTYKTINIFLGDNVMLPILRVQSDCIDKETLIKVAKSVEIKKQHRKPDKICLTILGGIEDKKNCSLYRQVSGEYKIWKVRV